MIVPTPQLVGTPAVCALFGVRRRQIYERLGNGDPLVCAGYLGKIADRHTWNLHELCAGMFTSDTALDGIVDRLVHDGDRDPLDLMLCAVDGCDQMERLLGLCRRHLHYLMETWRHAKRSSLVVYELLALCRWVVERNEHITLPDGFDPWSGSCMTPDCDGTTNDGVWHGPLCRRCTARFWHNRPDRERPAHWTRKGTAA